ncbi:MAG: ATPase [Oscillatoriales cyanobacterium RM2_1_1]|nr:ATPase [Oscillatoriales cyanobacterium SM2_3_0]NJO47475.1 ATPase [Oscillatoriales cyanobacterium RM2_1_1]
MRYVLGIDGGGTKTVCVLMDEIGQVISRGEAGPANYQVVGLDRVRHSIEQAIEQALEPAIAHSCQSHVTIQGMGLGLAGIGRPEDFQAIRLLAQQIHTQSELPVQWHLHPNAVITGSDSLTALVGGLGHGAGVVAISGTGSHIFGRNRQGQTKRVGGWGYLLGDEGSSYDIGIQGLRVMMRAYDGRGESTGLLEAFQTHLNLQNPESLIQLVYRQGWGAKDIAALGLIVDQVAVAGDPVAQAIITQAAEELALATRVAVQGLFKPGETVEVVTQGGTWRGLARLRQQFTEFLQGLGVEVQVVWPRYEPANGAGLLALQALGFKILD